MAAEDLRVRAELAADGSLFQGYRPRMRAVHDRHAARLAQIVAEHGWPSAHQVGEDGAEAAWLVVQHAIAQPAFQRQALGLLSAAAARGEVPRWQAAMLEDRIRVLEGRPQRYGTQFDWDSAGQLSPLPIEDPAGLDERRKSLGLRPLEEEIQRRRRAVAQEGERPPADRAAHQRALTTWLREVGWRTETFALVAGIALKTDHGNSDPLTVPAAMQPNSPEPSLPSRDLEAQFGRIDIYLFDQLLRGRLVPGMRILDAGCGAGRNLVYLLRSGFEVFGADPDPQAIAAVRHLAATLAPQLPAANFRPEVVEAMSFPSAFADGVISNAVLHFARDDAHFGAMLEGAWRALKPGGLFFCRLASSIGLETQVRPMAGRRHRLPDGSERYLVDAPLLGELTRRLGGTLADPIKTTVVQDQRAMTTWVVRKNV